MNARAVRSMQASACQSAHPVAMAAFIGEGLAQFGEIRKTTEKVALGQPHEPNLYVLVRSRRFGPPWYPFAQLLTDDRLFQPSPTSAVIIREWLKT